ncbi:MAG: non-lysosomal glucosylceramidase [Firmicutes bacterium]|nr:non-lysosomal glucosylceramidase [Bacillota bacterium]
MKTYDRTATAAKFLLGGIGTGNISLDQNARLCDFELWNKPNKGFRSPYTFFAVRTESQDGEVKAKALESQLAPPFDNSHGAHTWELGGLPRFRNSEMRGQYPFVNYKLTDSHMPVEAKLEAFTPLIPLATDDSSLPVAVLRYSIKNITNGPLTVSVAGSMSNLCGIKGFDAWTKPLYKDKGINKYVENRKLRGIHFSAENKTEADLDYFEMAMVTTEKQGVTYLDYWNEEAWWDGLQDFWTDFTHDGELTLGRKLPGIGNKVHTADISMGSVCVKKEIAAGEETAFDFIISWYHPNRVKSWHQNPPAPKASASCCGDTGCCPPEDKSYIIRNYYAKFGPPLRTAEYLIDNIEWLEGQSRSFSNALMGGTMPEYALDAVLSNVTVIRSNTCFRVEDGTFFGWEGCFDSGGCCDGNCSHVWNYTQTMAYLFPDLERSMRETEFLYETEEDGRQSFRALNYLHGHGHHSMPPATDGQLGTIIRLYRDWKLCGNDVFLKKLWPTAKLALEYAFTHWDIDGDGLMEGEQHNTYDIEFFGVSSMLNSIFFAALRAGEEMARYLGDTESADKYAEIMTKGSKKLDELTFNGEFYVQKLDNVNDYKYQYGQGCLADQLLGQQLAHACGLGYVLDKNNVKSAVHSIFKYNFIEDFSDFANVQRLFALNQNKGLLLCSWPNGGRPIIPFVYSDEVWTGIEYQVASHLIYEGLVDEGLKIVEACRARHDGIERNPWNEVECGHHYARSLASYGVLLALTGFNCDAVNKTLKFNPAINQDNFSGFFCCPSGWGIYYQERAGDGTLNKRIETLYGDLSGYEVV